MRSPLLLAALALTLSACAGTSGTGPRGWAASRDEVRSEPRPAPRPVPAARPAPRPLPPPQPSARLVIPVAGVGADRLRDSFEDARSGGRVHHAIDIAAPTGTPALAATDGVVTQKRWNRLGGRTLYLTSADGRYDFYYAHLDSYADGVEVGTPVARGQTLGTVGETGNARGPHLHFQVLDRRGGGRGTPVNPFTLLLAAEPVP